VPVTSPERSIECCRLPRFGLPLLCALKRSSVKLGIDSLSQLDHELRAASGSGLVAPGEAAKTCCCAPWPCSIRCEAGTHQSCRAAPGRGVCRWRRWCFISPSGPCPWGDVGRPALHPGHSRSGARAGGCARAGSTIWLAALGVIHRSGLRAERLSAGELQLVGVWRGPAARSQSCCCWMNPRLPGGAPPTGAVEACWIAG